MNPKQVIELIQSELTQAGIRLHGDELKIGSLAVVHYCMTNPDATQAEAVTAFFDAVLVRHGVGIFFPKP